MKHYILTEKKVVPKAPYDWRGLLAGMFGAEVGPSGRVEIQAHKYEVEQIQKIFGSFVSVSPK